MSEEKFVVFLFSIIVIIAFIYYIYKEIKEHQDEEQIRIYEEKRKKEFETLLATKRKEDNIKWNQKIQRQLFILYQYNNIRLIVQLLLGTNESHKFYFNIQYYLAHFVLFSPIFVDLSTLNNTR